MSNEKRNDHILNRLQFFRSEEGNTLQTIQVKFFERISLFMVLEHLLINGLENSLETDFIIEKLEGAIHAEQFLEILCTVGSVELVEKTIEKYISEGSFSLARTVFDWVKSIRPQEFGHLHQIGTLYEEIEI